MRLAAALAAAQAEAQLWGRTLVVTQDSTGNFVTLIPGQVSTAPGGKWPVSIVKAEGVETVPTRWELIRVELNKQRTLRDALAETYSELCGVYDEFTDSYSKDQDVPGARELEAQCDKVTDEIHRLCRILENNEPADSYLAHMLAVAQADDAGPVTFMDIWRREFAELNVDDYELHTYTYRDLMGELCVARDAA